jgi:hypothetical protein
MINEAADLGRTGLNLILNNICSLLRNLAYETPNNDLKTKFRSLFVFSE